MNFGLILLLKNAYKSEEKRSLRFAKALVRKIYIWQPLIEKIRLINIITFMDDLVVDVTEKMPILVLYSSEKCFI